MPSRFVISDHALSRFTERTDLDALEADEQRQVLLAELERGVPFGGQVGNDELYLLPCGAVAAIVWEHGTGIVKTVLTREHALANMEARGTVLRAAPGCHREPDVEELRELAVRHFDTGISRKARNARLRELGYDPAGEAGEIYRDAYYSACRAALEAKWAAHREAYLRRKASAA